MTHSIAVRLDTEIIERLNELSKKIGKTRSCLIKEAIEENLLDMELVYLAQSRSESLKEGVGSTIGLEEIKIKYGL